MTTVTTTITVSTVHPGPSGGAIFTGKDPSGAWIRVIAMRGKMMRAPVRGEAWRITGNTVEHPKYGEQFHVTEAQLLPPTGKFLVKYLTSHPAFRGTGIGQAKASRLYHRFGEQLTTLLDCGDAETLSAVVDEEVARRLMLAWLECGREAAVVSFLDKHGVDVRLANKILHYWPADAVEKLQENPYRLLVFAGWPAVDRLAATLGVGPHDERRLVAAAEASVYTRLDTGKDTLTSGQTFQETIKKILHCSDGATPRKAAALAVQDGALTGDEEKGYQPLGCAVMEQYLMSRFESMARHHHYQPSLFSGNVDTAVFDIIDSFERQEGVILNAEQRSAVSMAAVESLGLITGGAGVGKTTVLKVVHLVANALDVSIIQMALSGRAAQRMREATGREAYTIAGFLNQVKNAKIRLKPSDLIIIDEASMLDLMLTYRIVRSLPEGVRLLLVGDPYQLPPIGPGLIFQVLARSPKVCVRELTQVHRQAESTGIPAVAASVRNGSVPDLPQFRGPIPGVSFIECQSGSVIKCLLDIVGDLGGPHDVQILGVTKRGPAGVTDINRTFHLKLDSARCKLAEWDLAETTPVMYTVNDYDRELYNGTLGYVEAVPAEYKRREGADDDSYKVLCNFDGRTVGMTDADLPNLELAYAITTHKAQGSQFRRVAIPVAKSRLLDRTLLYTALTRGVEQVIFVGDKRAFCEAIMSPPSATRRNVGFSL